MLLYWIILPIVWVLAHLIWRIEVVGREHYDAVHDGRALVIASNHICNLDPVYIAIALMDWRRMCILAKEELFQNPFIGWFLGCLGAVPIDRGKGDTETIDRVIAECKRGTKVLVFPEGTRSKDGRLGKMKSGAFVIAAKAGADILPCRIIYDTPDARMHLFCRIRICFGELIPAGEAKPDDPRHEVRQLRALRTQVTAQLEELYAQHHFDRDPLAQPAPQEDKGENHADPAC